MLIIETAITLIIVFSILVIAHEFGHFIVAKKCGIKVEEFALGFGPKLVTLAKLGDTSYTIRFFPLGGFVKLTGMEPGEENISDGFQAQAIWKRAITIFAGPLFSFLLALVVFVTLGLFWGFPGDVQNRVGMVSPQTEAARMGLRSGDKILEIEGKKITSGMDMISLISNKPGENINLKIQRGKKVLDLNGKPRYSVVFSGLRVYFKDGLKASVQDVFEKKAASEIKANDILTKVNDQKISSGEQLISVIEKSDKTLKLEFERGSSYYTSEIKPEAAIVKLAGTEWFFPGGFAYNKTKDELIKYGDVLVSINGKKIKSGEEMVDYLNKEKPMKLSLKIKREKLELVKTITLSASDYTGLESQKYIAEGKLGFMPEPELVKTGFVKSISQGLSDTGLKIRFFFMSLFSPTIKDEVGGPIMIAKITQSSVALGPYAVANLLGSLSLSLAIINLIPIPIFDGGHLLLLAIEKIRRKRLSTKEMQTATVIGLAFILLLMFYVFSSDIFKMTHGLVPQ